HEMLSARRTVAAKLHDPRQNRRRVGLIIDARGGASGDKRADNGPGRGAQLLLRTTLPEPVREPARRRRDPGQALIHDRVAEPLRHGLRLPADSVRDIRASAEVRALIGAEPLQRLHADAYQSYGCAACGRPGTTTEPTTVTAERGPAAVRVTLNHAACAPSRVRSVHPDPPPPRLLPI